MIEKFNIIEYCLKPYLFKNSHKTALVVVDAVGKQQSFTYIELYQEVCRLTEGLKSLQLPKSSPVTIKLHIR